ncbi:MAG TPA: hypothetical protein VFI59_09080 [Actinomycetota bacterium]|nr:hypothetical protein [Actinomycetota bacterium]
MTAYHTVVAARVGEEFLAIADLGVRRPVASPGVGVIDRLGSLDGGRPT